MELHQLYKRGKGPGPRHPGQGSARATFWALSSRALCFLNFSPVSLFIIHSAIKPVVNCVGRCDYKRGTEQPLLKRRCFSVSPPQTGRWVKYGLRRLASLMFKGRNLAALKALGAGPLCGPEVRDMGQRFWSLQKDGGTPKRCYLKYTLRLDVQGAMEENTPCCSCCTVLLFVSQTLLCASIWGSKTC